MIYIRTGENHEISFIHYMPFDETYGMGKTETELNDTGYLVESVPEYTGEIPEGKQPVTCYDGEQFYFTFVDVPVPPAEQQDELLLENQMLRQALTILSGGAENE